jgi:hypothetical protein
MILLKLNGEKVIGVYVDIPQTYQPKENEFLIDELPPVTLNDGETAQIWLKCGKIEYEIRKRNEVK